MRIIPVMDIMEGSVVHGTGGERKGYEPIKSTLTESTEPTEVALKFEQLGFEELYIADIDAIERKGNNLKIIEKISSKTKLELMVDAGFWTTYEAEPYVEKGTDKIIFATETISSFQELEKANEELNATIVGSLDIKKGEVLKNSPTLTSSISETIKNFESRNAKEIILLNLQKVGSSQGPDYDLLEKALLMTELPLIVGGGIRNISDLQRLKESGSSGALISTSLHNGSIKPEEIQDL